MDTQDRRQNFADERARIQALDMEIVRLLIDRFQAADRIGAIKRELGLPIEDREREVVVLDAVAAEARRRSKDEALIDCIRALYVSIISQSKMFQNR
ncbi:MAG: chorismate mutase [Bacillota bacterium]|nr:chorismate mutase [Bacillota bacterium]